MRTNLRWPKLFQIVARPQGKNIITEKDVEALSYVERCLMLNANPIVVAKQKNAFFLTMSIFLYLRDLLWDIIFFLTKSIDLYTFFPIFKLLVFF